MERRDFLKKAGVGTAVATGTLAAPAIAQGREKLTMARMGSGSSRCV